MTERPETLVTQQKEQPMIEMSREGAEQLYRLGATWREAAARLAEGMRPLAEQWGPRR